MLKKVSVSSVPRFDITVGNAREDAHVFCHGKTAKLHSRNGGLQDEKQGKRLRKESLMPPIPSARNSPSFRKTPTNGGQDGFHPNTPSGKELDQNNNEEYGLKVVGETGYLPMNSTKKSTAEKLSDTGFHSNKLPKILKPKKKVSKGSKRKKTTSMNDGSQESQDDNMSPRLEAIEGNKSTSDVSSAGEDNEEFNNKYGLNLKREFNLEVTRPFTFSYFPNIHINKKKKDGDKETEEKKMRKISKVKTPSSLS